jgi:hypothetical protein
MPGWTLLFFLAAATAAGAGANSLNTLSALIAVGSCGIFSVLGLVSAALLWMRNH